VHNFTAEIDLNSTRPEINLNKQNYQALYCFICGRVVIAERTALSKKAEAVQ